MSDFSANNFSAKYTPCQHLRSARRNNIVLLRCMPNKSHFDQMEKDLLCTRKYSDPHLLQPLFVMKGIAPEIFFFCATPIRSF